MRVLQMRNHYYTELFAFILSVAVCSENQIDKFPSCSAFKSCSPSHKSVTNKLCNFLCKALVVEPNDEENANLQLNVAYGNGKKCDSSQTGEDLKACVNKHAGVKLTGCAFNGECEDYDTTQKSYTGETISSSLKKNPLLQKLFQLSDDLEKMPATISNEPITRITPKTPSKILAKAPDLVKTLKPSENLDEDKSQNILSKPVSHPEDIKPAKEAELHSENIKPVEEAELHSESIKPAEEPELHPEDIKSQKSTLKISKPAAKVAESVVISPTVKGTQTDKKNSSTDSPAASIGNEKTKKMNPRQFTIAAAGTGAFLFCIGGLFWAVRKQQENNKLLPLTLDYSEQESMDNLFNKQNPYYIA